MDGLVRLWDWFWGLDVSACCCRMSWVFQMPCCIWGVLGPPGSRNLQCDLPLKTSGCWKVLWISKVPHSPFLFVCLFVPDFLEVMEPVGQSITLSKCCQHTSQGGHTSLRLGSLQPLPSEQIERALGFSGTFSISILRKYLKLKNTVILIFRLPRVIPDSAVGSLSSRSLGGQPLDSFWEYRCTWEEENLKLIEYLPCIWLRICVLYITTYLNLTANTRRSAPFNREGHWGRFCNELLMNCDPRRVNSKVDLTTPLLLLLFSTCNFLKFWL